MHDQINTFYEMQRDAWSTLSLSLKSNNFKQLFTQKMLQAIWRQGRKAQESKCSKR